MLFFEYLSYFTFGFLKLNRFCCPVLRKARILKSSLLWRKIMKQKILHKTAYLIKILLKKFFFQNLVIIFDGKVLRLTWPSPPPPCLSRDRPAPLHLCDELNVWQMWQVRGTWRGLTSRDKIKPPFKNKAPTTARPFPLMTTKRISSFAPFGRSAQKAWLGREADSPRTSQPTNWKSLVFC